MAAKLGSAVEVLLAAGAVLLLLGLCLAVGILL